MTGDAAAEAMSDGVRVYLFQHAATTGQVPQAAAIATALGHPEESVRQAIAHLAAGKVLIQAPNGGGIWAANPFCAVPSGFRVRSAGITYWGICIWDALGIAAALGRDAEIEAPCGDCGAPLRIAVAGGELAHAEGIIHFAVPARQWWENIGFA